MSEHVETEFKFLFDDDAALDRVRAELQERGAKSQGAVLQRNHFFDSPAFDLRRVRMAIRLREEAGRFVVAFKGEAKEADAALTRRPEAEFDVTSEQAAACLEGAGSPLDLARDALAGTPLLAQAIETLGTAKLVHAGSFDNLRDRIGPIEFAGEHLTFELDRTTYPGGRVDCELEVECKSPQDVGPALEALLTDLKLQWRTTTSKAQRFFEALS